MDIVVSRKIIPSATGEAVRATTSPIIVDSNHVFMAPAFQDEYLLSAIYFK